MKREELSALPEFQDYDIKILPTGEMVKNRRFPEFMPYKIKPDDIILFSDKEGSWFVDYHFKGGPYKKRAIL